MYHYLKEMYGLSNNFISTLSKISENNEELFNDYEQVRSEIERCDQDNETRELYLNLAKELEDEISRILKQKLR